MLHLDAVHFVVQSIMCCIVMFLPETLPLEDITIEKVITEKKHLALCNCYSKIGDRFLEQYQSLSGKWEYRSLPNLLCTATLEYLLYIKLTYCHCKNFTGVAKSSLRQLYNLIYNGPEFQTVVMPGHMQIQICDSRWLDRCLTLFPCKLDL